MSANSDESNICTYCGYRGYPILAPSGHIFFEVVLWLCYIVPGIIYSIWRRVRPKEICPECKHPSMISAYSAKARQMMALANIGPASKKPSRPKLPSGAAKSREKKYMIKRK